MANLLFELHTEELPPLSIEPALEQISDKFNKLLELNGIKTHKITLFATSRRLTLFVENLPDKLPDKYVEIKGPKYEIFFQGDKITTAGESFLKKYNANINEIEFLETEKGKFIRLKKNLPGAFIIDILPNILVQTVSNLHFPKLMKWNETNFLFSRPIRNILALLDDKVINVKIAGISANNYTYGHLFISPGKIEITRADINEYKNKLKSAFVVVDQNERRQMILKKVEEIEKRKDYQSAKEILLDELVYLSEYPEVLEFDFPQKYLQLPQGLIEQVLIAQKFIPCYRDKKLLSETIVILNRPLPENYQKIQLGNQRVVQTRLEDAMYYYENDIKIPLESLYDKLDEIYFIKGLGTIKDKVKRMEKLANKLSDFGLSDLPSEFKNNLDKAIKLSKNDLLTRVVYEFPTARGTIGKEYAIKQGISEDIAKAIEEQYFPEKVSSDYKDISDLGALLCFLDKIDYIISGFLLGFKPTSNKDPLLIRKQTFGLIKLLQKDIFKNIKLAKIIKSHIVEVINDYESINKEHLFKRDGSIDNNQLYRDKTEEFLTFFNERLYTYLVEQKYEDDIVKAVIENEYAKIREKDFLILDDFNCNLILEKIKAITNWRNSKEWDELYSIVERTGNILDKTFDFKNNLISKEELEKEDDRNAKEIGMKMFQQAEKIEKEFKEKCSNHDFDSAINIYYSSLKDVVSDYFNTVFVNVENRDIRLIRHKLLYKIHSLFADNICDLRKMIRYVNVSNQAILKNENK